MWGRSDGAVWGGSEGAVWGRSDEQQDEEYLLEAAGVLRRVLKTFMTVSRISVADRGKISNFSCCTTARM